MKQTSNKRRLGAAAAGGLLILLTAGWRLWPPRYTALAPGALWEATVEAHADGSRAAAPPGGVGEVLAHWAALPLPDGGPGWNLKVGPPRQVLARLATGQGIEEANRFLQSMEPWAVGGSEWDLRELWGFRKAYSDRFRLGHRGDYDFTQSVLVGILYLFGDRPDLLYPDTRQHLLDHLLVDRGGRPRTRVPRSMGLAPETENHILMTESARYLVNQWLRRHGKADGRYDNRLNGLEEWLGDTLEQIRDSGFHEFNSIPYQGYALQAVINLEAHAESPRIARLSRALLDAELWRYAFGSLAWRRSAPFRRQAHRAAAQDLLDDRMTPFAAVWAAADWERLPLPLRNRLRTSHVALDAAAAPYRPPEALAALLRDGPAEESLVRMGRGPGGSPEIHFHGPGFLLSAGGAAPPRTLEIAVRPIVLLLDDGLFDGREYLHMPPRPESGSAANRTGVYHRFACGDAPVRVPERFQAVAADASWTLYRPLPGNPLLAAVHNRERLGLLALFPEGSANPETLLRALENANRHDDLPRRFTFPGNGITLEYDVEASRRTWVMRAAGGRELPRDFAAWPRLEREDQMNALLTPLGSPPYLPQDGRDHAPGFEALHNAL